MTDKHKAELEALRNEKEKIEAHPLVQGRAHFIFVGMRRPTSEANQVKACFIDVDKGCYRILDYGKLVKDFKSSNEESALKPQALQYIKAVIAFTIFNFDASIDPRQAESCRTVDAKGPLSETDSETLKAHQKQFPMEMTLGEIVAAQVDGLPPTAVTLSLQVARVQGLDTRQFAQAFSGPLTSFENLRPLTDVPSPK